MQFPRFPSWSKSGWVSEWEASALLCPSQFLPPAEATVESHHGKGKGRHVQRLLLP